MPIASRSELHELIEKLPESELPTVLAFLRTIRVDARHHGPSGAESDDPVALALANAPEDDEPSSAEEDALNAARWESYRRGDWIAHDDVRREIGW